MKVAIDVQKRAEKRKLEISARKKGVVSCENPQIFRTRVLRIIRPFFVQEVCDSVEGLCGESDEERLVIVSDHASVFTAVQLNRRLGKPSQKRFHSQLFPFSSSGSKKRDVELVVLHAKLKSLSPILRKAIELKLEICLLKDFQAQIGELEQRKTPADQKAAAAAAALPPAPSKSQEGERRETALRPNSLKIKEDEEEEGEGEEPPRVLRCAASHRRLIGSVVNSPKGRVKRSLGFRPALIRFLTFGYFRTRDEEVEQEERCVSSALLDPSED